MTELSDIIIPKVNNIIEDEFSFRKRVNENSYRLNFHAEPFRVYSGMISKTYDLVSEYPVGNLNRALSIFNWMDSNFFYDKNTKRYQIASKTFKTRRGMCLEFGVLYTTLARIAGIESNIVTVDQNYKGESVDHACSSINLDGKIVLVDVAYHKFDVKHNKYKILSDEDTIFKFYFHYQDNEKVSNDLDINRFKNKNFNSLAYFMAGIGILLISSSVLAYKMMDKKHYDYYNKYYDQKKTNVKRINNKPKKIKKHFRKNHIKYNNNFERKNVKYGKRKCEFYDYSYVVCSRKKL